MKVKIEFRTRDFALAGSLAFERGKGPIWDDAWIRTTYIAKK